jgi:hypothetical protein
MVLYDSRYQPAGFFKIEIHRVCNKKPAGADWLPAAGILSTSVLIFDQNTARRTQA